MNRRILGCLIPHEEYARAGLYNFHKYCMEQLVQEQLRKQGYEEAYVLESYASMTHLGTTIYFTARNLPPVPENKLVPQKNIGLVTLEDRPLFELLEAQ